MLGGISRDNLGEVILRVKIAARQWRTPRGSCNRTRLLESSKTKTLQMVTLQVNIQLFFLLLDNFGAGGKQERGRELCAEIFMDFSPRSIFTCSVTV